LGGFRALAGIWFFTSLSTSVNLPPLRNASNAHSLL
jgi:hypothetical protein